MGPNGPLRSPGSGRSEPGTRVSLRVERGEGGWGSPEKKKVSVLTMFSLSPTSSSPFSASQSDLIIILKSSQREKNIFS